MVDKAKVQKKKGESEIEKNWRLIFHDYDIIKRIEQNGQYDIRAAELRKYFEPRLLCKMDFREKVPPIFENAGLSILAIRNGEYRIAPTDPFFDLDLSKINSTKIENAELPQHITTIQPDKITNESQALDAASASSMLEKVLGEATDLTIRGRRRCHEFQITLKSTQACDKLITYEINGVQIEVDGGMREKIWGCPRYLVQIPFNPLS